MKNAAIGALPPRPDASEADKAAQHADAIAFLTALRPTDLLETTLAIRIVALHYAAMACFHRAAQDSLPVNLHQRVVGKAVALCRLMDTTMRELSRRQGSLPAQPAARSPSAPAPRTQPAPEPTRSSTPTQPLAAESRHERRRRERAERHHAAAMQRTSMQRTGAPTDARAKAMQQRVLAEAAARAAAPAPALAA